MMLGALRLAECLIIDGLCIQARRAGGRAFLVLCPSAVSYSLFTEIQKKKKNGRLRRGMVTRRAQRRRSGWDTTRRVCATESVTKEIWDMLGIICGTREAACHTTCHPYKTGETEDRDDALKKEVVVVVVARDFE